MGTRPVQLGAAVLVIGLAWCAGCRSPGGMEMRSPLPGDGPSPRVDLNARQMADLQVAYARTLEKRGEVEQAQARYQEAVRQDPQRGDAWLRLAILHDREGRFAESADMYRKALASRPGDPEIYCDVGYSFYLQRRWAEAEMNLRQALALRPNHARAHNNLGLLLARTGRDEEALAQFRQAGGGEADSHANLAFALALEGQWPEAKQHYQAALAADPTAKSAKAGMAKLDAALAKLPASHTPSPAASGSAILPAAHWEPAPRTQQADGHP